MAKTIDLTKSVRDLMREYPELTAVLAELGLSDMIKDLAPNSPGESVSLPEAAKMYGIPMAKIAAELMSRGFRLAAKASDTGPGTEKEARESLRHKNVKEEIAKRDSYPRKDYSNKLARAQALEEIEGHPLRGFTRENEALSALLGQFGTVRNDSLLQSIRELSLHYARKGDLLYPLLKAKYGISGPSDLMWTDDDEIRDELSALADSETQNDLWAERLEAALKRVREMIHKEQDILFPICAVNFTEEEWFGIYRDSRDYPVCFGVVREQWPAAEQSSPVTRTAPAGEIVMPGGHMTPEQLTALLNTIPLEITFVDENNINRFFNEGPKVFKRPGMAVDREVFSCHPPKIEPMVRKIIDDFRSGRCDSVPVWMEKGGRTFLVRYMAVRDPNGSYLGTVELVQDMEFAKEHFRDR